LRAAPAGLAKPRDSIGEFFTQLAEPGHLATFEGQLATIRFDVTDGQETEHWLLTVADGDVAVTRRNGQADAVARIARQYLEAIVTGRLNAQAALLRGLFTCEGSMAAFIMFQRCLPGPPGSTGRVAPISSATVMRQRGAV
jgi:SCP-2 sterol transfer family protein